MFLFLLCFLQKNVYSDVPNITINTDTISDSPIISMPITKVVLYGDRGEIIRSTSHPLQKGIHTLRLESLPSTVSSNSLRLHSSGATLIRMENRIVESPQFDLPEIQELIQELESIQLELSHLIVERLFLVSEFKNFQELKPLSLNKSDFNQNVAQYDASTWKDNWKFIRGQQQLINESIQFIDKNIHIKQQLFNQLKQKVYPILSKPYTQKEREVVAVVYVENSQDVELDLHYTVGNAQWRPTYDIHYDSILDEVRIESAALVQQNTGENWENVEIQFATSRIRPHRTLPQTLTWTLGEKNEYLPSPRPVKNRIASPLNPPPVLSKSESEKTTITQKNQIHQPTKPLKKVDK
jgi:uncharacterized protein (TIGR02231 family)